MALFINFYTIFSTLVLLISTFSVDVPVASAVMYVDDFRQVCFPTNVRSGGSLAFETLGRGPFAGTTDGRVLYFSRLLNSSFDFAFTSPTRTKAYCDGTSGFSKSATCGFTKGLSFTPLGDLYAADPFVGLTSVGILGGQATTEVRNSAVTPPLRYINSVDYASDGMVYFTDTSAAYGPQDENTSIQTKDATGRLLQYNPTTRNVTTLLSGLQNPVGVASSANASFLFVTEPQNETLIRYWLKGEKAGTSEEVVRAISINEIKRNAEGNFWLAANARSFEGAPLPYGRKIDPEGNVLDIEDFRYDIKQAISSVIQRGNELFIAVVNASCIYKYTIYND